MNLVQQITPKNEDGSIDHRYGSVSKAIIDHAGAALHLVCKSYAVDMDEYQ